MRQDEHEPWWRIAIPWVLMLVSAVLVALMVAKYTGWLK